MIRTCSRTFLKQFALVKVLQALLKAAGAKQEKWQIGKSQNRLKMKIFMAELPFFLLQKLLFSIQFLFLWNMFSVFRRAIQVVTG